MNEHDSWPDPNNASTYYWSSDNYFAGNAATAAAVAVCCERALAALRANNRILVHFNPRSTGKCFK